MGGKAGTGAIIRGKGGGEDVTEENGQISSLEKGKQRYEVHNK